MLPHMLHDQTLWEDEDASMERVEGRYVVTGSRMEEVTGEESVGDLVEHGELLAVNKACESRPIALTLA